jgi:4-diphosphocytidyl-2-C-methyl-D-erythritol kinase
LSVWISEKAKAKINLSLHVRGRRDDGYHELDSIVAFADVSDELQLRPALQNSCVYTGPFAAQLPAFESNIILKVWQQAHIILAMHSIDLPCVEVKLEKNLPVASGIGGGSADAAAMLRAVFKLVEFEISGSELTGLAQSLGADVPVCFLQKPCRMQGIGEVISPYAFAPQAQGDGGLDVLLVNPNLQCSTANVFSALGLSKGQTHICNHSGPHNDLTNAAIFVQPAIQTVLDELKNYFADVRMSGSGATCFALGDDLKKVAEKISSSHPQWWVKAARLG